MRRIQLHQSFHRRLIVPSSLALSRLAQNEIPIADYSSAPPRNSCLSKLQHKITPLPRFSSRCSCVVSRLKIKPGSSASRSVTSFKVQLAMPNRPEHAYRHGLKRTTGGVTIIAPETRHHINFGFRACVQLLLNVTQPSEPCCWPTRGCPVAGPTYPPRYGLYLASGLRRRRCGFSLFELQASRTAGDSSFGLVDLQLNHFASWRLG